jgi:hypothetical protein
MKLLIRVVPTIEVMYLILICSMTTTTKTTSAWQQSVSFQYALLTRKQRLPSDCFFSLQGSKADSSGSSNDIDQSLKEAARLREQAEKLRLEVATFEQSKKQAEQAAMKEYKEEQQKVKADQMRRSAVVPILKPDGSTQEECVFFRLFHPDTSPSYITVCQVSSLPMGLILGESNIFAGAIVVDEAIQDGTAAMAGVQVGDILRACTACRMGMDMPTWQVLAGGIGRPSTKRFMYSVDGRPLEEVLDAISSNRMDTSDRPILLVIERQG